MRQRIICVNAYSLSKPYSQHRPRRSDQVRKPRKALSEEIIFSVRGWHKPPQPYGLILEKHQERFFTLEFVGAAAASWK